MKKKAEITFTDFLLVGFFLFTVYMISLSPKLQQTESAAGSPTFAAKVLGFSQSIRTEIRVPCSRTNEIGIAIIDVPKTSKLDTSKSTVIVEEPSNTITYGGDRLWIGSFEDTCFATFYENRVNCYKNVLGVQFNGRASGGDAFCPVKYNLEFIEATATTTTTLPKEAPIRPSLASIFGNVFQSLLDWLSKLFLQSESAVSMNTFALVEPNQIYSKTFILNTTSLETDSCNVPSSYTDGICKYYNKCYIIMPRGCNELSCSVKFDCIDITDTFTPNEALKVEYTPTQLNREYAVAVFIAQTKMSYEPADKKWFSQTDMIADTKQSDLIQVLGAPQPPPATDIFASISTFLQSIWKSILDIFKIG